MDKHKFCWISYLFMISSLLLLCNGTNIAKAQYFSKANNELSATIERIRGGWEPSGFFDGHLISVSYNRTLIPYILFHSEVSLGGLLEKDIGEGYYYAERHFNSLIISDIGIELIPISISRFQLRFGLSGSLQYRQTSDGMDPVKKQGAQRADKVYFFNYSSSHIGFKFELKTPFALTRRFYIAPLAAIRSYRKGQYDIPRSFEVGIQGGYQF